MSSTKTVEKKGLSLEAKRNILISVIAVLMAILLAVSVVLILTSNNDSTDDTDDDSGGSSTLTIKNGDFAYYSSVSDDDSSYPKVADNWTQYAYKEPVTDTEGSISSHGFTSLEDSDSVNKIVSGVVSTDEDAWETVASDLSDKGITSITNPGVHDEDLDANVYMFATTEATSALIASKSFGVSSQTSAKITVWLNTAQLGDGTAFVVLQQYNSPLSALRENSSGTANIYAYQFGITKDTGEDDGWTVGENGWISKDFYIFNRNTSSKSLVMTVGIGDPYAATEETCEGILFVDDIQYETITANDYRIALDEWSSEIKTNFKILGEDEITEASEYSALSALDSNSAVTELEEVAKYLELDDAMVDGKQYSPFTSNDKFSIYYVSNDGTTSTPVGVVLDTLKDGTTSLTIKSDDTTANDYLHISFWVRVVQNNVTAQMNIVLQENEGTDENPTWVEIDDGAFDATVTSQTIDSDSNCGWTKYEYYIKPNSVAEKILRVVVALGDVDGYDEDYKYLPNGTLYVTSPLVENINSEDYSSASSGSYAKKISLVGNTASTSITNGSFSSVTAKNQPESWSAAIGGSVAIFRDGVEDTDENLQVDVNDVTAVVVKNNEEGYAPKYDDDEQCYLRITNNIATSYGYLSPNFTLSAKTVYAVSVLARTEDNANPYIYLLNNNEKSDRSKAVIASFTSTGTSTKELDNSFAQLTTEDEGNGWVRYYFVIATGTDSMSVRLALFNGSIDGEETQQGTVCYDAATLTTLGTYTITTTKYEEDDDDYVASNDRSRLVYTATSGYEGVFEEFSEDEISALSGNNTVKMNSELADSDYWTNLIQTAYDDANADDEEDDDDDTTTTTSTVDWSLLMSVISSVALIGALMIVLVVRIFRKRKSTL